MNLRTLKKLSKRAAPLLLLLDDTRKQFPAEREDNYTHTLIPARKHWERSPCHASYEPWNHYSTPRGMPIKRATRQGRHIVISPPSHPRKGTIMVGCTSGYYEPEWVEETAWEALRQLLFWEFAEFDSQGEMTPTRSVRTPREVFQAAQELIAQRAARSASRQRPNSPAYDEPDDLAA